MLKLLSDGFGKLAFLIVAGFAILFYGRSSGRNAEKVKTLEKEKDAARNAEDRYRNRPSNVHDLLDRLRNGKRG